MHKPIRHYYSQDKHQRCVKLMVNYVEIWKVDVVKSLKVDTMQVDPSGEAFKCLENVFKNSCLYSIRVH